VHLIGHSRSWICINLCETAELIFKYSSSTSASKANTREQKGEEFNKPYCGSDGTNPLTSPGTFGSFMIDFIEGKKYIFH
jgi:hypothetical protein